MVSRSVVWKAGTALAAGPLAGELLAGLVAWLGVPVPALSALWLWAGEPLESSSAAAIPPPALPMNRPVDSRQTPAAKRKCVEISFSSHQQGTQREVFDANSRILGPSATTISRRNSCKNNSQQTVISGSWWQTPRRVVSSTIPCPSCFHRRSRPTLLGTRSCPIGGSSWIRYLVTNAAAANCQSEAPLPRYIYALLANINTCVTRAFPTKKPHVWPC